MKQRFVITFLGALVAITGCTAAQAAPARKTGVHETVSSAGTTDRQVCTGNPNELFCDDFNGTSLDASKWSPDWLGSTGPVNTGESACYSPSHVTVHDGELELKLTETPSNCKGANRPETTGIVTTSGKFATPATDYRVVVRAFIPGDTSGTIFNWPAIWDNGRSWPNDGESDVMEGLSGHPCFHYHSPAGGPGGCASGNYVGWHSFREDVVGSTVTYRYDGTVVGSETAVQASHYLVEGEQGSGSYGGPRHAASMLIRSVRVIALRQKG